MQERKYSELGSEFWTDCTPKAESEWGMRAQRIYETHPYKVWETLAGRTALEHVAEMVVGKGKRTICLPSYCCHTMIEPFLRHGMEMTFYDVIVTEQGLHREIDANCESEVFLLMDYFGHTDAETKKKALELKSAGKMLIYDATHAMYSDMVDYAPFDYVCGSYRKWVDINCGFFAWKEDLKNGEITQSPQKGNYANVRAELFEKKAFFMNGGHIYKEDFYPLIGLSDSLLACEYHHQGPDERSKKVLKTTDVEFLKKRRWENARVLTEGINEMNSDKLRCLNPLLNAQDISLFVPVVFENQELRDLVRKYLIEKSIFLPVHWPLSKEHKINERGKSIYGRELSVVCDQRYGRTDMERILTEINEITKIQ